MVSGPSGAGKTTVVAGALERRPDVVLSVSATTRDPRPGEQDGREYRFLSPAAFADLEDQGGFLEHAEVHGNRYGTPRADVEAALAHGRTVVLEIDVQGAEQVRAAMPDAVTVFVLPPSEAVLRQRLSARGTEDASALETRLTNAFAEIAKAPTYDHRIVNEDLERSIDALVRILDGSRSHEDGPSPSAGPAPRSHE